MKVKEQVISEILEALPMKSLRYEMSNEEWRGWFSECWDKAIDYHSKKQLKKD